VQISINPEQVAFIDEQTCIGCTRCIQACPVVAILGAARQMHTVIARECIGCELCVPVCPVDCITLQPARETLEIHKAELARRRHEARLERLEREQQEKEGRRRKQETSLKEIPTAGREQLQAEIAAAVARAKAKKAGLVSGNQ
jgi:electron transport complex protein RnfB